MCNPIVKSAFLFCCFTGHRFGDKRTLEWKHIHESANGKNLYIEKKQVKTGKTVVVPLSEEALKWMPEQQNGESLVFHELQITQTTVKVILEEWMKEAGINKHITYHCSHMVASMAISAGADISTVGKILGHKSTVSTQVYAKVSLESKMEVVNLTNGVFG